MKKKKKKTNAQLIIDVLMAGKNLRSKDISDMITERRIKIQDVASMLSKLNDENRCELGHFIIRIQDGPGYVYNMVKEIRSLPKNKVYDLTRKTGKNRYTLEKALEEIPGLRKYVKSKQKKKEAEPKKKAPKIQGRPAKSSISDDVPDSKADIDTDKLASEIIQKLIDLATNARVNVSLDFDK